MNRKTNCLLHLLLVILVVLTGVIGIVPIQAIAPVDPQSAEAVDPGDWHQEHLSLAVDKDGNVYAAWEDYRNGNVSHIRSAYRPAATVAQDQIRPAIGVDVNAYVTATLDHDHYIPMPIPIWEPPLRETGTEHYIVSYDSLTGVEEVIPTDKIENPLDADHSKGKTVLFEEEVGEDIDAFGINNFTELEEIPDPENYPWRVNAKLFVDFPNASNVCSGVLIDPRHILTAGHCVFAYENPSDGYYPCVSPETSCWASTIRVVPAYENGDTPYGEANSGLFYSWSGWTQNHNHDWDMGYLLLDRPVGALTSWYSYGYNNDDSFFENNAFHNPGYPSESPYDGETMWYWHGDFDTVYDNILYFNRDSFGGQSGSGTYYKDGDDNRIVYTVLSHDIGGTKTGQTRINADKFSSIQTRINANTPSQVDLVPLDVNVSPTSVFAGNQLSSMNYLLHNYSSATWNGTVTIQMYLSDNNIISSGDTSLGSGTVTGSIGPKSSLRVNVTSPPWIPSGIDGTYWIGIIVDISDASTGNNDTSGWDAAQVNVIGCDTPDTPSLTSPSNGSTTNDNTPTFDWNPAIFSSEYQIMVDNNSDWSSPEINTFVSSSMYTPISSLGDDTYYWAVRGHNTSGGCNIYGSWSSVWSVTIDTTPPSVPTLYSPSNGSTTSDNMPDFDWSSPTGATQYQIQVDNSSSFSSPEIDTTISSSNYTPSSLSDGTYYWHVRARDSAGNWSNWTSTWSFTIDTGSSCDTPGTPSLVSPSNGSTTNDNTPYFDWNSASNSNEYQIQVDDSSGFSSPVIDATRTSTDYISSILSDDTYYWRVRGRNTNGGCDIYGSWSSVWSVTIDTTSPATILLVDDDDNNPDVRSYYTNTLDELGMTYDVWDTGNSDNEPDSTYLAQYDTVIWFTGDEFNNVAGPGSAGENALATWLDTGKCLFISSQEYHYDRGLTTFMATYLGVASANNDVSQNTVTGTGSVFGVLGLYSLSYPFTNYSDQISPDGTAELAFSGDQGDAAVNKDSGVYRTTFWGFPFEAISAPTDRQSAMSAFLNWCGSGGALPHLMYLPIVTSNYSD